MRLHSAYSLFPCFYIVFSGIESMRAGHYRIAYTCFKLAADRGYSKAQFNVGLCYEHGRGTEKDLEKVSTACRVLYVQHGPGEWSLLGAQALFSFCMGVIASEILLENAGNNKNRVCSSVS